MMNVELEEALKKVEFNTKTQMASRLNALYQADPNLVYKLLNDITLTTLKTAITNINCVQINDGHLGVTFLGIINGLAGENYYSIRPLYEENKLIGFVVEENKPTDLITVNKEQISLEDKNSNDNRIT